MEFGLKCRQCITTKSFCASISLATNKIIIKIWKHIPVFNTQLIILCIEIFKFNYTNRLIIWIIQGHKWLNSSFSRQVLHTPVWWPYFPSLFRSSGPLPPAAYRHSPSASPLASAAPVSRIAGVTLGSAGWGWCPWAFCSLTPRQQGGSLWTSSGAPASSRVVLWGGCFPPADVNISS